jgi:hypothetical protein
MPTRKQRRRRKKSFRHDYEYVFVDEEGNEVEVERDAEDGPATPMKDKGKSGASATKAQARSAPDQRATTRTGRVIQPPSWRRVGKRALIFGPVMFIAVSLLDQRLTVTQHAAQTIFLLAFFLPFSYVMDAITYRMYLRRSGQAPPQKEKRQPPTRSPR